MDTDEYKIDPPSRNSVFMRAADQKLLRILEVFPDEDMVIYANLEDSTTLPLRLLLSDLLTGLQYRKFVPVSYEKEEKQLSLQIISETVRGKFEKVKPALTELLALGYRRLSEGKMWAIIRATAEGHGIKTSTLNGLLGKVIKAGGVLQAAAGDYSSCGRKSTEDGDKRPTNDPRAFPLSVEDIQNIIKGGNGYRDSVTWNEAFTAFLQKYYPARITIVDGLKVIDPLPPKQRPSLRQFKYHARNHIGLKTILENKHRRVFQSMTSKAG